MSSQITRIRTRLLPPHGAKHAGLVRTADEDLADEFPRVNRFAGGKAVSLVKPG